MGPNAAMKPKNSILGMGFIDSMLAAGPRADFAEMIFYGVTNNKVQYSDKVKSENHPLEDQICASREGRRTDPQVGRAME